MVEDLSRTLLEFIDASIPTVQAAEALPFLAANRGRDFSPDEIVVGMRPQVITAAAVSGYAAVFAAKCGTRRIPTRGQGGG